MQGTKATKSLIIEQSARVNAQTAEQSMAEYQAQEIVGQISSLSQESRSLTIETPLGKDKLLLRSFSGYEAISKLFHFELEMVSEDSNIEFDKIIGQNVTIAIKPEWHNTPRYFNGYVNLFARLPRVGRYARYRAEFVPWLWFLTRSADCFIFQEKTIPEIIKKIFEKYEFANIEDKLKKEKCKKWEYCVQYRETDFNFVMRLMEQEGISFFFKHEFKDGKGKHILVLADAEQTPEDCPNQATANYEMPGGSGSLHSSDIVDTWQMEHELRAGKYTLSDFNYLKSKDNLLVSVEGLVNQGGNKKYEIYDYPGEYEDRDGGKEWAKVRMEEEEAGHIVATGSSNCRSFAAGYKFKLNGDPDGKESGGSKVGSYLLTSVRHHATAGSVEADDQTEADYGNTFICIPDTVAFRPPRITPKPVVYGCQTATVVGKKGEEIYVDKYGRVKVQFHWDRQGKRDEKSSCWIRVAQPWAGKKWGAISIPRVGQEVIVEFLEGDPDRPIITGGVYNNIQMPPYDLPDNRTQSGIKSRSSLDGGAENFNELRFEDKKGEEEIYLHAEKQLTIMVEQDKGQTVGNDESLTVKHDRTKKVEHDEKTTIIGNRTETIEQGNESITLIAGDREITIATGCDSLSVGQHINTSAKLKINIQAGVELNLIGPGGSIKIDATGVTIQGVVVKIN